MKTAEEIINHFVKKCSPDEAFDAFNDLVIAHSKQTEDVEEAIEKEDKLRAIAELLTEIKNTYQLPSTTGGI